MSFILEKKEWMLSETRSGPRDFETLCELGPTKSVNWDGRESFKKTTHIRIPIELLNRESCHELAKMTVGQSAIHKERERLREGEEEERRAASGDTCQKGCFSCGHRHPQWISHNSQLRAENAERS